MSGEPGAIGEQIRELIGQPVWAALEGRDRAYFVALADDENGRHVLDVVRRASEDGLSWVAFRTRDGRGVSIDLAVVTPEG